MWTTSNFRVRQFCVCTVLLAAVGALFGSLAMAAEIIPPDAPRVRPETEPARKVFMAAEPIGAVELKTVRVRHVDESDAHRAGVAFMKSAREPYAIEVQTEKPLGNVWRDAAPVIVLNGERLLDTLPVGEDRLIAYVPDLKGFRDTNHVAVEWLGEQQSTKTRRPLTFGRDIIGK